MSFHGLLSTIKTLHVGKFPSSLLALSQPRDCIGFLTHDGAGYLDEIALAL